MARNWKTAPVAAGDIDDRKVLQVCAGMFKRLGILPGVSADEGEAMMTGNYQGLGGGGSYYERFGAEIADKLRQYANAGTQVAGRTLVDIDEFGYVVAGRERGFMDTAISGGAQALETFSGGMVDLNGGGGIVDEVLQGVTGIDGDALLRMLQGQPG